MTLRDSGRAASQGWFDTCAKTHSSVLLESVPFRNKTLDQRFVQRQLTPPRLGVGPPSHTQPRPSSPEEGNKNFQSPESRERRVQEPLSNFERQFHRWRCEPPLNAFEKIDFKRLANVVACQIFESSGNHQPIGTCKPRIGWHKHPLSLLIL